MKRISIILLTLIYFFSTLGVSAKSMYCMGVLKSTSLNYAVTPVKPDACKMGKTTMKGCCQTKKQYLKVQDKHSYQGPLDFLAKLFPVLFNLSSGDATANACKISQLQQTYNSNAPPGSLKTPVYILNCNFRI